MSDSTTKPLNEITILEFCQYLSGPSAGLRLADLGARVIKIENPKGGDAGRKLAIKNLWVGENSLLFHTINRNKESMTADLKSPEDLAVIKKLIAKADVLIHNFRPGVMQKMGLDYDAVREINPKLIYAAISGYGDTGPWKNKPGQDLLLQAMSGLMYSTGNSDDQPVPFGLAVADIMCGAQVVQGILAALIRRQKTGKGALIELSMMESLLDFQFELLTTYYVSGHHPQRCAVSNGHPLLGAPYGIYRTADGFIAVAMVDLQQLARVLECDALLGFTTGDVFRRRDEIKSMVSDHLSQKPSAHWLEKIRKEDIWATEVMDWKQLIQHEGYRQLKMEQSLATDNGNTITTTRCPIRINGNKLVSEKPAPNLGKNTEKILLELSQDQH